MNTFRFCPRTISAALFAASTLSATLSADELPHNRVERAAVPGDAIEHVMVIDMENEDFAATFGATSPAVYLNSVLLKQGELIPNYFATSHVSLGNYVAQVSGQGPTQALNNDCLDLNSLSHPPVVGGFTDIVPGTVSTDSTQFPGQVIGDGCVFPAPFNAKAPGARTIGDQLDARHDHDDKDESGLAWRGYAEDMGDDLARDYGTPDPTGGADCAHPPVGGADKSNSAAANDQYATRHNPFMYFHSVIDNQARCDSHVVPLGKLTVGINGATDQFQGHLAEDLKHRETTPKFMFVTPNLCNDGHDANCVGANVEGTKNPTNGKNAGGLVSADLWLKHWLPMIFASPAYKSGKMLVVLTFDESGLRDARACANADQSTCNSPTGPNLSNPGFSPVLALFKLQTPPTAPFVYPGGGQVGAVLFNKRFIEPGSVNTTGSTIIIPRYAAMKTFWASRVVAMMD